MNKTSTLKTTHRILTLSTTLAFYLIQNYSGTPTTKFFPWRLLVPALSYHRLSDFFKKLLQSVTFKKSVTLRPYPNDLLTQNLYLCFGPQQLSACGTLSLLAAVPSKKNKYQNTPSVGCLCLVSEFYTLLLEATTKVVVSARGCRPCRVQYNETAVVSVSGGHTAPKVAEGKFGVHTIPDATPLSYRCQIKASGFLPWRGSASMKLAANVG